MGQYYKLVNLDKKEYIKPHTFGDGAKLKEFGSNGCGMMTGLAMLLSSGNGRGGGDLRSSSSMVGHWAGDRIVCTGDYDDENKWVPGDLYSLASEEDNPEWKNISWDVIKGMCEDPWMKYEVAKHMYYTPASEIPAWLLEDWHKAQKELKSA